MSHREAYQRGQYRIKLATGERLNPKVEFTGGRKQYKTSQATEKRGRLSRNLAVKVISEKGSSPSTPEVTDVHSRAETRAIWP